jgi:hypothetical protein
MNRGDESVTTRDSRDLVRQRASENGALNTDSGAPPQNSETGGEGDVAGRGDPIAERLRAALRGWEDGDDPADLRRALLDLLLELER